MCGILVILVTRPSRVQCSLKHAAPDIVSQFPRITGAGAAVCSKTQLFGLDSLRHQQFIYLLLPFEGGI